MANSQSAQKRIRQNEERRDRNKVVRSRVRTKINDFLDALEAEDVEEAEARLRDAEAQLDRAVSKGVWPRNRASRKTSRLAKRLNELRDEKS